MSQAQTEADWKSSTHGTILDHNGSSGPTHAIAGGLLASLASASIGAYVVTVDQTIVFWNTAAERILGFVPQDVLGRRCHDVLQGTAPGGLTAHCLEGCPSIRYLRAGLVPAASRLELLCSSGERKWVSVSPMVVTGILKDAPLLVHLFDDASEAEHFSSAKESVCDALVAGGADILSDRPADPPSHTEAQWLTRRELEILRLVALGRDAPSIAAELGISRHTVRNHIRNLRQKLNATTKLDAVVKGIRLGILQISR